MNSQFVAKSGFVHEMMPNECHRGTTTFLWISLYACVYVCTYPPRVHEKRRDTRGERKGREERIRAREKERG